MANRFWVGGTASWNGTATGKWSTTSGGASGAAEPTASDDVIFNASSGSGTVTLATNPCVCRSLTTTGFTGTITGTIGLNIGTSTAGSLTIGTATTWSYTGALTFLGSSTNTLTSNSKTIASLDVNAGTVTLQDALTLNNTGLFSGIQVNGGTLNTNGKTVTTYSFLLLSGTLTLGASAININTSVAGNGGFARSAGTFNANTSTITLTGNNTFGNLAGGNFTVNNLTFAAAASVTTSSLTVAILTMNPGSTLTADTITAAVTIAVTTFTATGTALDAIFLTENNGVTWSLTRASGTVSCDYMDITNNAASGGALWYAGANSVDEGGNTGWVFTAPPGATVIGSYYTRFLAGAGNV